LIIFSFEAETLSKIQTPNQIKAKGNLDTALELFKTEKGKENIYSHCVLKKAIVNNKERHSFK